MQTSTRTDLTLDDLADEPIWLAWQTETRTNKQGKLTTTKVPYAADGSDRPGSSTDARTWGTKREARLAASKLSTSEFSQSGVGIVLGTTVGDGLRLGGTDLDTCIGNDDIEQWAADIIQRLNSYSERSPSKTGAHILFLYRDSDRVKLEPFLNGKDGQKFALKSDTNHPPSVELYLAGRYFTVTDEILISETLRVVDADDLLWLLKEAGPKFVGAEPSETGPDTAPAEPITEGRDKNAIPFPTLLDVSTATFYRDDEYVREVIDQLDLDLIDDFCRPWVVRALAFRKKYNRPMGQDVTVEFADVLENEKKPTPLWVIGWFDSMAQKADSLDTKYLRDRFMDFVRYQTARDDVFKAGTLLSQHDVEGYREVIEKAAARSELIGHGGLQLEWASDVEIEPIRWTWPGYIPREAITLVAGPSTLGKTTLVLSFIATITTARVPWPDGTVPSEPANVLILSAEDKPKNILVPRLMAMGADLRRIAIVKCAVTIKGEEKIFSLADNLPMLEDALKKHKFSVVMIDPLMSYLGGKVNAWVETQVRGLLWPVQNLMEKYDATLLGIMHFKKGIEASAMHQISNSIAFTAAARAVFTVVKEKNSDRTLFLPAGANWAKGDHGFAYRKEDDRVYSEKARGPIDTFKVVWEGRVEGTADDVLLEQREKKGDAAKKWLIQRLTDGPVPMKTLKKEVEALGDAFSWSAVERASDDIVHKDRDGFAGGSVWSLK